LHERFFCHLWLPHLQLDELRTRLRCAKQVRLSLAGYRPPHARFCRCLSSAPARNTWRMSSSTRSESAWPPFCLPLFTSDGLNLYFSALTAHFGQWREVGRRGRHVRKSAGGCGADLRPGEEKLSAAQAGASYAGDAPGDTGRSHARPSLGWASLDGSTLLLSNGST
jgi:hypothetical protein